MKAKNDCPRFVVLLSSKPEPLCIPPNSTIAHSYVTGVEDNSFYPAIFWPQSLKRG